MARSLMQLRGVLWRNILVKRRSWKRSVLEILIPGLIVAVMILISFRVDTNRTPAVPQFPSYNVSAFTPNLSKPILASPDLQFTSDVMDRVIQLLGVTAKYTVSDDVDSREKSQEYREKPDMTEVGIHFLPRNTSSGLSVDGYILRVPYEMVREAISGCSVTEHMEKCGRDTNGLSPECPGTQTLTSGLLSLQWSVETALIQTFKDPGFQPPALQVQMMPVPAYTPGTTKTQLLVTVSMVIALAPLAYFLTVTIVTEKKTWARVVLRSMGLADSVFWISWWIPYMMTALLVSVLTTVLVAVAGFFSSMGLVFFFVLVLLYGASLLGLGFLLSVFFNTPKIAGLVASLASMLLGLLYLWVSLTRPLSFTFHADSDMMQSAVPFAGQLVFSLLSPVAFALGIDRAMFDHEASVDSDVTIGQFPLLAAILMLVFDATLYTLFAVYLDKVVPSKYRFSVKPWFCLIPARCRRRRDADKENDVIPTDTPEGPHIEPMCEELSGYNAIRIRDLSKKFGGQQEPVFGLNGLDLDIYEGQITCVLGHPGAGKTTLMNILAGIMPPTSGTAYIYDLNVSSLTDHEDLASTVAFSPQRDVMLGHLSVEEHLHIAALVRGTKWDNLEQQIESCLKNVGLDKERKTMARKLNGSEKRRLSLALAFIAHTKVLLLDEPTFGMDPEERCHLWKLLHAMKQKRVIVFTSKHMVEADYYADRTVVLSTGRLRCVGTSSFLKKQFSVGYHLDMTIRTGTSTDRLMKAVKSSVRGANLTRCEDNKLTISIPPLQTGKLTALFKKLESKERGADFLGINNYCIAMTTLEQVFWKLEPEEVIETKAAEEEAGNVFISPLLTPSDDTFANYDDNADDYRRDSVFPPSPRSPLEEVPRRFSGFPSQQISRDGSDVSSRRKSAFPYVQRHDGYQRSVSHDPKHHNGTGGIARRLSHLFARPTPQAKPERDFVDLDLDSQIDSSGEGAPRRTSMFVDALLKKRKDRSKSFALGHLKKSHTSHVLTSMAETSEIEDEVEMRPKFNGVILPTSLAERRATVAAFKDFRRTVSHQSNLSGLSSLVDSPAIPSDPMAKLNLYGSYEQNKRTSFSDVSSSVSGLPSAPSSLDDAFLPPADADPHKDPEKARAHPAKIGEVLTNLKPTEPGVRLELQQLGAMLKLRALLCLRNKGSMFLRTVVCVGLTLVAVGLSFATPSPVTPPSLPAENRTRLFGIKRLWYRNESGEELSDLLQHFYRTLDGQEHISQYTADLWDRTVSLESLLDVLKPDGNAYKLYYNATCGLALPHLTSFVSHVMRGSPNSTSVNQHNNASLAPRVSAFLQPWPTAVADVADRRGTDWATILFLGLALLFVPIGYAVRLLRERKKNIRSYLCVAGVGRVIYYGSVFVVDVIEFLIPAALLVVLCVVSKVGMFEPRGAVECLVLLVLLSVPVGVLWAHLASFAFSRPRTCGRLLPLLLALVTVGCFCLVHFLDGDDTEETAKILHYVFTVIWAPYIPFGGLIYISKADGIRNSPESYFFEFDTNIDICFFMLVVDIVVLFCLVLLLDKLTFRPPVSPCCSNVTRKSSLVRTTNTGDDSLQLERQRIQDLHKENDKTSWPWLVVDGLSTVFTRSGQHMKALDNATFAVKSGEVLSLLGPPGSGKSTVLNVMLGECPSSAGSVHMDRHKVDLGEISELSGKIGYCPQDNTMWDCLTVDQHFDLMGGIRGVHKKDLDKFRESLYHDLDLNAYRSQKIEALSACEKRKLSFALSMLGTQAMMFLDEPSTGMDPRSRRLYWDAVNHFVKASGRGAIVTTHSVEEAQALCSRLAVMVNGQLKCLGTSEELQEQYSKLYTLEVRLRAWDDQSGPQRMEMLTMFLRELFPKMTPQEQFQERAVFTVHCDSPDFSLANTFDTLESLKRNLDLEDFTFSQSTLEQLFLDLARQQKEGESKYTNNNAQTPACQNCTEVTNPEKRATDTRVDIPDTDSTSANQNREAEAEGGTSCQDAISGADAAVGVVIVHHSGDDNGGGVAGVEEGGATGAGAAAPVVFSLEGVDNPAFTREGEDMHESRTTPL